MTSGDVDYKDRFPRLYAPVRWEWAGFDGAFSTLVPEPRLVTNVHVVGFVGERVVVCRTVRNWFLPGGTREADESIDACVVRELREEAGARVVSPLRWIGAHHGVTDSPVPYRPWQPHPHKSWLWCSADVEVDGAPTNPEDGEQVVEVRAVSVDEARELLAQPWEWLADLVSLAVELRGSGRPGFVSGRP
ncbi:MAG TPA: NUDIX hydrolase [Actinocrinis sp.]|nr:NUDIX hydrolase [Actinocrinis sp.]